MAKKKVDHEARVLDAAKAEVCSMLEENSTKIMSSYKDARDEHPADSKTKFKFGVGLTTVLEQKTREDIKVSAKISFGITFKDETMGQTISAHPNLPGMDPKTPAEPKK